MREWPCPVTLFGLGYTLRTASHSGQLQTSRLVSIRSLVNFANLLLWVLYSLVSSWVLILNFSWSRRDSCLTRENTICPQMEASRADGSREKHPQSQTLLECHMKGMRLYMDGVQKHVSAVRRRTKWIQSSYSIATLVWACLFSAGVAWHHFSTVRRLLGLFLHQLSCPAGQRLDILSASNSLQES